MSDEPHKFRAGQPVRCTGGKYNGMEATVRLCCDTIAQIEIQFEGKCFLELVEHKHLQDLAEWGASKSLTELSLKNAPIWMFPKQ